MPLTAGLLYLAASVACSVIVAVLLKLARRHGIDIRQAIAANYAMAALLCWITLSPAPAQALAAPHSWLPMLALAVLLPSVFVAMARSVRHAGIVRSDAAQRLSLFIPLLAAFALFDEPWTARKGLAIAVAFVALACVLRRSDRGDGAAHPEREAGMGAGVEATARADADPADARQAWLWPLAVWVGYGAIDILFKTLARTGAAFAGSLLAAFVLSGLLMLAWLLARRVRWGARHLGAGLVLGLFNYANILTYIKAHQSLPGNPALVFACMNMGVITLGALVGALAFREKLSGLNIAGLLLALAAIALMTT